jgi:8-oxo-dGTP diphosphatase
MLKQRKREKRPVPRKLLFAVLASDVALFTIKQNVLLIRLIKVHRLPHFPNSQGLPGGLIHPAETAEEAAVRLLRTKAKIETKDIYIEQLFTFSEINRDPRGRVVAVGYTGFVPWDKLSDSDKENSPEAWWTPATTADDLAYDHDEMLAVALERLRSRITYTTLISKLLPKEFTLTELEEAYKCILNKRFDRRNFRKKLNALKIVKPVSGKKRRGKFRPAQLYTFSSRTIENIEIL